MDVLLGDTQAEARAILTGKTVIGLFKALKNAFDALCTYAYACIFNFESEVYF